MGSSVAELGAGSELGKEAPGQGGRSPATGHIVVLGGQDKLWVLLSCHIRLNN